MLVDLECKSDRHRSVGQGFAAFRCLKVLGYDVVLIHASSWKWGEMRCGGVCHGCKDMAASLGQIRHLIPNMSRLARSRGSVTSSRDVRDAPADDASGEHSSHPTADHPTAGHPTTDQLDEIRRLVQGLATDVGHLRTEQVEIKRMAAETGRRSRSPLRRRRLPTPPSPPRRRRSPSYSRKMPPWRMAGRGRSPTRGRSPSTRPSLMPRPPDHPPPHISDVPGTDDGSRSPGATDGPRASTLPQRSREPPNDRDELERLIRNNLSSDGPFDNKNVSVTSLDGELLSEVVSFCIREGNRDRLFWICKPGDDPQTDGVRMNVLIRDHIRPNRIVKVANGIKHWKRSTWIRPRIGGAWELIEDNVDSTTTVRLNNSWIDVIVFHHPPRGVR